MFRTNKPLILASGSPRRKRFLADLGLDFTSIPADIPETVQPGEAAPAFALRMAAEKALLVAGQHPASYVLGCDTVVTLEGVILGKPADKAHALETLRRLQGRTHQVITGLCLICLKDHCHEQLTRTTEVTFDTFSDAILERYISSGEPMDKAGAYGLQGKGGFLVRSINGSCSNVIGLPLSRCVSLLLQHRVIA